MTSAIFAVHQNNEIVQKLRKQSQHHEQQEVVGFQHMLAQMDRLNLMGELASYLPTREMKELRMSNFVQVTPSVEISHLFGQQGSLLEPHLTSILSTSDSFAVDKAFQLIRQVVHRLHAHDDASSYTMRSDRTGDAHHDHDLETSSHFLHHRCSHLLSANDQTRLVRQRYLMPSQTRCLPLLRLMIAHHMLLPNNAMTLIVQFNQPDLVSEQVQRHTKSVNGQSSLLSLQEWEQHVITAVHGGERSLPLLRVLIDQAKQAVLGETDTQQAALASWSLPLIAAAKTAHLEAVQLLAPLMTEAHSRALVVAVEALNLSKAAKSASTSDRRECVNRRQLEVALFFAGSSHVSAASVVRAYILAAERDAMTICHALWSPSNTSSSCSSSALSSVSSPHPPWLSDTVLAQALPLFCKHGRIDMVSSILDHLTLSSSSQRGTHHMAALGRQSAETGSVRMLQVVMPHVSVETLAEMVTIARTSARAHARTRVRGGDCAPSSAHPLQNRLSDRKNVAVASRSSSSVASIGRVDILLEALQNKLPELRAKALRLCACRTRNVSAVRALVHVVDVETVQSVAADVPDGSDVSLVLGDFLESVMRVA